MIQGLATAVLSLFLQSAAAVYLNGALCAEDMDEATVELFNHLAANPIRINYANKNKLEECGLFTAFQIASLLEYRERSGDILSIAELGRLDGWNPEFANALREYVDLGGSPVVGKSSSRKSFHGSFTGRYGSSSYLTKASMEWNERWSLFVSSKKALPLNICATYYGRGPLSKVVIGNFNARFAQGLALWSGFTINGFATVEALSRRESGVGASLSTSSACNGVAAQFCWKRWTLSAGSTLKEEKTVLKLGAFANLNYLWSSGQCGITAVAEASRQTVSANWRFRLGKADFYGEAAWEFRSRAPAVIAGIRMDPQWKVAWGIVARYYSPGFKGNWSAAPGSFSQNTDEAGLAAALRWHWVNLSTDTAYRPGRQLWQNKTILNLAPEIPAGWLTLSPFLKYTLVWKPTGFKHQLRADFKGSAGPWQAGLRGDCTWCKAFAWLALAEAGFKNENLSCFLRAELFNVENWDDRIYVYQRDVPGSFNVPARYGKGMSASITGGYTLKGKKEGIRHQFNFRAGAVLYRKETEKPSASEWRVQYALKW